MELDNLNDFGFSTVSEAEFNAKKPETQVVEKAVEQAKTGQLQDVEQKVNKIWSIVDYHFTEVDKHKEQLNNIYMVRMKEIESLIVNLLKNLAKTSDNEYIYWPNRKKILEQQIEKINSLTSDSNLFVDAD